MRIGIIGVGAVGLACAYALGRRGAMVTVFDKGGFGGGTSKGNTGWVTPSIISPLARPGFIAEAATSARAVPPLVLRPEGDAAYLEWRRRFANNCMPARYQQGLDALVAIDARTSQLFDGYKESGVEFEMHSTGLLIVARDESALAHHTMLFDDLARRGYEGGPRHLSVEEVCALEPALSPAVVGAARHAEVDRYTRPESFTRGLVVAISKMGAALVDNQEIEAVDTGPLRLRSADDSWSFDAVVLAAGLAARDLLSQLGVGVPMTGAKGYSVTYPPTREVPTHAIYLAEPRVGISPYQEGTRIAGVFDFEGTDVVVREPEVAAMLERAEPYFARWRPTTAQRLETWSGLRPVTADGLPFLDRVPGIDGVFAATGHGQLGIQLSPATAELMASLILDGERPAELEPFRLDRPI